ncbi:MAG: putative selenium-dependent hydroxylase accessory protein YqeC [Deltaproteobacteria bacterium]|jgi:hypothetical protein|nr:putative selenium-dependent hydroxylase accessory protein YqeC [Deltaproteobacteria bacterium]
MRFSKLIAPLADRFLAEPAPEARTRPGHPEGPNTIAVIGGGGKTSVLRRLEMELSEAHLPVITTVTTRLGSRELPTLTPVRAEDPDQVLAAARRALAGERLLLFGPERPDDRGHGTHSGLPPDWLAEARELAGPELTWLVEADGSKGRPLKAHREGEPVFPPPPYYCLLVIGLTALTLPWPEALHRPETFYGRLPLPTTPRTLRPTEISIYAASAYRPLKPDLIYLNQTDALTGGHFSSGRQLAHLLSQAGFRVACGSLKNGLFLDWTLEHPHSVRTPDDRVP